MYNKLKSLREKVGVGRVTLKRMTPTVATVAMSKTSAFNIVATNCNACQSRCYRGSGTGKTSCRGDKSSLPMILTLFLLASQH